jgi:hypothetical protein
VKKTDLLPKVIGGDLLFVQNLSIYGEIIGFDEILFTYHQREIWNDVSQDYRVFFGRGPKPKWYIPFFVTSYWQISSVFKASVSIGIKLHLFSGLISFQSKRFLQKVGLKLLKYLMPSSKKHYYSKLIYWRYLHSSNIKVLDMGKFEERVIKPTLNLS